MIKGYFKTTQNCPRPHKPAQCGLLRNKWIIQLSFQPAVRRPCSFLCSKQSWPYDERSGKTFLFTASWKSYCPHHLPEVDFQLFHLTLIQIMKNKVLMYPLIQSTG